VATYKGGAKNYLPTVKRAWCGLGRTCTEDIVSSFMGLITPGGMVESLIKAQFKEIKDLDVKMLGPIIVEQFALYCEREPKLASAAGDAAGGSADEDPELASTNRQQL